MSTGKMTRKKQPRNAGRSIRWTVPSYIIDAALAAAPDHCQQQDELDRIKRGLKRIIDDAVLGQKQPPTNARKNRSHADDTDLRDAIAAMRGEIVHIKDTMSATKKALYNIYALIVPVIKSIGDDQTDQE